MKNIRIQNITKDSITLNINGQEHNIPHKMDDLLALLEQQDAEKVQIGEKIYNIGEIGEARFETIIHQHLIESKRSYYLRIFLMVLVPLLAIGLAYFGYQYQRLQEPIVCTVAIDNLSPNPDLPMEQAEISLRYGDETKTEQVRDNEVVFKGIPSSFRSRWFSKKPLHISFRAHGFYPLDTTWLFDGDLLQLPVRRDDTYGRIFGRVLDEDSKQPIADVKITIQSLSAYSDAEGNFELLLPLQKQRKRQRIATTKEGYQPWDRINEPIMKGEETTIYLSRIRD